jgi:hypothetical protein
MIARNAPHFESPRSSSNSSSMPTGVSLGCLPPRLPGTLSRFRLVDRRPTGAPFTVSENGTSGFKEGAQACGGFVIMKSY